MGIVTGILYAVAAIGAYMAHDARQEQKRANASAAAEQKKVRGEENALNASKQAQERRAQIREERVRRGRIMQAAENTGVGGSSGESGALGSLGTQLQTNLGINAGYAAAGQRIGEYQQNAADFNLAAQNAALKAQDGMSLFQMGMSGAGKAGG